jgi:hypothetical protein
MTILTKKQWEASVAEAWSASIKATYKDLIDAAVLAEREACAIVCEAQMTGFNPVGDAAREDCADAIRARSKL